MAKHYIRLLGPVHYIKGVCHRISRMSYYPISHSTPPLQVLRKEIHTLLQKAAVEEVELDLSTAGVPSVGVPSPSADCFVPGGGNNPRSLGDSLLLPWLGCHIYLFPPLPLMFRVVNKLPQETPTGLLTMPWWPPQSWFLVLLGLVGKRIISLHLHFHDVPYLNLTAWRLP